VNASKPRDGFVPKNNQPQNKSENQGSIQKNSPREANRNNVVQPNTPQGGDKANRPNNQGQQMQHKKSDRPNNNHRNRQGEQKPNTPNPEQSQGNA
jgi:hypothetical protein